MARGPRYSVAFKRRRKGKTDYHARRKLILSRIPRLVVRGSLKHMIVQVVAATALGDQTMASAHSKELSKFGWQAPCGNVPAAYLTGLLAGYRALSRGVSRAILDTGLQNPTKGSRIYAAQKGALDSDLKVPCGDEVLVEESKVRGDHIVRYAELLNSANPELYKAVFSKYLSIPLKPRLIVEHFDQVKRRIEETFMEDDRVV